MGGGFANEMDEEEEDGLLATADQERQQDELLNNISNSLDTINRGALSFKEEIERQNATLDEIGKDMDGTQINMKAIEAKTNELVERAGGPGWFCIIVVLSAIAMTLFMLIIYT
ncbi:Syntaxin-61 [Hondaea fermentalgiana]|uniref:Syntaxin-61 n=1 Tax=Hondaea fermentalgiana TaxID=2315210 RepID=A0A2R5GGQ5_9STRA|nr:Syntaxin-61 [Hondaea fermentalgiana]|eukprot:GBG27451.1 Syntaxin-61 [Hondaea fermentalgiana]